TRANVGRKSPLEVLTDRPTNLADIVAFGSPCTVYASPKKALDRRGTAGIIVGKNEETKGFKVIVVKDNTLVTTRHVKNIETLSAEANEQLKTVLEREAEDDLEALAAKRQKEQSSKVAALQTPAKSNSETQSVLGGEVNKKTQPAFGGELRKSRRNRRKSRKQREADGESESTTSDVRNRNLSTRVVMSALKQMLAMSTIGTGEEQYRHLPDPKSYKAAMRMPDAHL
ncbi:hypothetical protein PHMEG_00038282, partial [Phytophthora megakarya]